MKTKVVVFNKNGIGAKVLINPEVVPAGALVNPDLRRVGSQPPEKWYYKQGLIYANAEAVAAPLINPGRIERVPLWAYAIMIIEAVVALIAWLT